MFMTSTLPMGMRSETTSTQLGMIEGIEKFCDELHCLFLG